MKVGLISYHSFSNPGGVKTHILALHQEFQKRGIISKIIIPRRKKSENYGKDVILLGTSFPLPFNGSQSDFSISLTPGKIEKMLKKENFDVLHCHNCGLISYQIVEKSNALNILTFHSCTTLKEIKDSFLFKILPVDYLVKKSIPKVDGVIGIAPFNISLVKKFGYNGKTAIIPNGIDLEKFNPENPKIRKFLDEKINILFVGRIEKRKGLIYLLKAYKILEKKYQNLRLIVVGEGKLRQKCQDFVKKHKLKNVIFEGEIESSEVPHYYTTADIFVAPAIFGESFGIVLLEAMASGCPVVAFANQGYKRILKDEGARFLVKPMDFKSLAQKIEILIKNKELRKEMTEWGIKEAQKYSWSKIADQVLNFYKQCLKNKPKRLQPTRHPLAHPPTLNMKEKIPSIDKIIKRIYNKIS